MGAQDSNRSWHELPFWTLVKNYFRIAFLAFIIGWLCTRILNFDIFIFTIHMQNLWLLIPEGVIALAYVYFWDWSRKSERKKQREKAAMQLSALMEQAKGGEKSK